MKKAYFHTIIILYIKYTYLLLISYSTIIFNSNKQKYEENFSNYYYLY